MKSLRKQIEKLNSQVEDIMIARDKVYIEILNKLSPYLKPWFDRVGEPWFDRVGDQDNCVSLCYFKSDGLCLVFEFDNVWNVPLETCLKAIENGGIIDIDWVKVHAI